MGLFLAASAFKDVTAEQLADAIVAFAGEHDVKAAVLPGGPADEATQAAVFGPDRGWTVVLWPSQFTLYDVDACQRLTQALGTVASTAHIYDEDYWTHVVLSSGGLVDRFVSRPDYFEDVSAEVLDAYAGDPAAVAAAVGCDADNVAPYLRLLPEDEEDTYAHDDDEASLDDPWVFADLWRAMGITYPADVTSGVALVDLGDDWDGLPSGAIDY